MRRRQNINHDVATQTINYSIYILLYARDTGLYALSSQSLYVLDLTQDGAIDHSFAPSPPPLPGNLVLLLQFIDLREFMFRFIFNIANLSARAVAICMFKLDKSKVTYLETSSLQRLLQE